MITKDYFQDLWSNKSVVSELIKNDFKSRYLGSYLGIIWAFIQPAIQILIFWFVFQIGFKNAPVDNFPFILWLISGYIPWLFFSDALSNSTYAIQQNSYLVKKVVFKISLLPLVKIISSLYVHLFFVIVNFVLFACYGYEISVYNIQVFYYLFALLVLLTGMSYITSSLILFFKDIGQIVAIILQFGFWITPIFWSFNIIPEKYHFVFRLNPVYYLVEGYRETFIYQKWFWHDPFLMIYYWVFSGVILLLGYTLFKKLKPHFSDVL